MKLAVTHSFPCSVDVFWQMFWDPAYDEMLSSSAAITKEILWDREEGGDRVWRMRFIPDRELPAMVAKAVGATKLVYEQESRLTSDGVLHWEVFPTVVPDKVTAKGTMRVSASGDGITRVVDGEIKVRIPLVGGRIEKQIHQSVVESYDRAAEVRRQWLREHGPGLS